MNATHCGGKPSLACTHISDYEVAYLGLHALVWGFTTIHKYSARVLNACIRSTHQVVVCMLRRECISDHKREIMEITFDHVIT